MEDINKEEKLTNEEIFALIEDYTKDMNFQKEQIENGLSGEALTDARNDIKYDEERIEALEEKLPIELRGSRK